MLRMIRIRLVLSLRLFGRKYAASERRSALPLQFGRKRRKRSWSKKPCSKSPQRQSIVDVGAVESGDLRHVHRGARDFAEPASEGDGRGAGRLAHYTNARSITL